MHARTHHVFVDTAAEPGRVAVEHRLDPASLACVFGEWTRAQIARRAAVNLTFLEGISWRRNARNGLCLDDLGFVRRCVQAAMDWNEAEARTDWADPLDDAFQPAGGVHGGADGIRQHNPNDLAVLCTAWGLIRTDLKARRPGDVLLFPVSLTGPSCSILLDRGAERADPDRQAFMTASGGAQIYHRHDFHMTPVVAFTWPEA